MLFSCWKFLSILEQATGVSFTVQPVPFVVKGNRQACTCKEPASQGFPPNTLNSPSDGDSEGSEDSDDQIQAIDRVTAGELEPLRQALPHTPVQALRKSTRRGNILYTSPPTQVSQDPGNFLRLHDTVALQVWLTDMSHSQQWSRLGNCAKPIRRKRPTTRPASSHGNPSQDRSSPSSGVLPISTINNRSAFFASPSVQPPQPLEVQVHQETDEAPYPFSDQQVPDNEHELPQLDVQIYEPSRGWQAPCRRVESIGNNSSSSISSEAETEARPSQARRNITIESSKKRLNLSRFRHSPALTVAPRTTARKWGRPKGSKNKKPSRATVRKESAVRERSAFAQAFRFHMERQQRSRK